ncbi:c-type cytochrome [Microvirga antarctica]|uniref:c-type cytochrome n=1 Tax=Microvirga antarctica TaxID=2819233 RepID=UPI001B306F4F|nr:cytochrome c [Microvirga antarctica]
MKRALIVAGILTLGLTAALAQSNIVAERQSLMKEFGAQTKTLSGMLRGQTPFNLAEAQAALKTISADAKKLPAMFPDSTKGVPKSDALPSIWEKKAEFEQIFVNLDTAASTAAAKITDEASFKADVPKVLQNCGTCHTAFRKG